MKYFLFVTAVLFAGPLTAQNLQLHYDLRHTVAPGNNPHNFPTLYFEYFKNQDTGPDSVKPGSILIKPGSFLMKMQADFNGADNNQGKFYMQVSQSLRFWKPKIYLSLQYSGGLGVTEPKQYSYYIANTFSVGADYVFQWKKAWFSAVLNYKYIPYKKPSNDFLYTLYWWKGLLNYKLELAGDFSVWRENKDHGDGNADGVKGKRFFFFAEPQIWYNVNKTLALGTRINMYYHVYTSENDFQSYPTVAVKCKF
ncbi:MAG TPA: DUF5020 family protein [Puia sp.]|nr:DUF5020 family protein [Puia sp.]